MFKVFSHNIMKWSQSWMEDTEDVDWFGDEPDRGESRLVGDDNLGEYLVDEVEKADKDDENIPQIPGISPEPESIEIPTEELIPGATRKIEYLDTDSLLNDGMNESEVIEFEYTNRHGMYSGTRLVEPHYIFHAHTTGNMILVAWDRNKQDIRAFIIGNIHPNGVRYEGERFAPKAEIMKGINPTL